MTIEIKQSTIASGSSGVIFDNNAGLLRINEIDVTAVSAAAFIATANNGASFLSGLKISRKFLSDMLLLLYLLFDFWQCIVDVVIVADVNSITFTTAGGSQTVTNSSVTLMTRMSDAFYVEDQGSTLLLEGVIIERNQILGEPWSAIAARTNSIVQISETTIADNTGVEFGVVAFAAMITIQDSFVRQNTGSVSYELRFKSCKTMVDTISHFLTCFVARNLRVHQVHPFLQSQMLR
jgi:hypothetical protein